MITPPPNAQALLQAAKAQAAANRYAALLRIANAKMTNRIARS